MQAAPGGTAWAAHMRRAAIASCAGGSGGRWREEEEQASEAKRDNAQQRKKPMRVNITFILEPRSLAQLGENRSPVFAKKTPMARVAAEGRVLGREEER